jgi:hypothetical protein
MRCAKNQPLMEPNAQAGVLAPMTGDRFRLRAHEYVAAAELSADPQRRLFFLDAARRCLRLATEIEAAVKNRASAAPEGAATQA